MEGGCLQKGDIELAKMTMAAISRTQQDDLFAPHSIDDYLQSCADIKMSAPIMDTMQAQFDHLIVLWASITPPPKVQAYHDAVSRFYLQWEEAGDIANVDLSVLQAVNDEAAKLGDLFVGKLITSGCGG